MPSNLATLTTRTNTSEGREAERQRGWWELGQTGRGKGERGLSTKCLRERERRGRERAEGSIEKEELNRPRCEGDGKWIWRAKGGTG